MEELLNESAKRDNGIMFALRANDISHVIAETDKGKFTIRLRKGGTGKDYELVLDAVPFRKDQVKEIMEVTGDLIAKALR